MHPISSFHLLDLIPQAVAVRQYTAGWSKAELITWLKEQGRLEESTDMFGNEIFTFESLIGFRATFYLRGTRFTFLGDHTFFQPQ
jgi:hypothetical protein